MVYIDENGAVLESVDLSKGYLEDAEWVDHAEVPQQGHFEYEDLNGGGKLQKYIVDVEYKAAWREVTAQRYILYTEADLEAIAKSDYAARLEALEAAGLIQNGINNAQSETNELLTAQVMAVSDRGDFIEDCIAEMAGVIYA